MNNLFSDTHPSAQAGSKARKAPACGFPYCCFVSGLQDYRAGELTRVQVQVLEYLLFLNEHYLREGRRGFWHSYRDIADEVWMAKATVKTVVADFVRLGFLSVRQTRPRDQLITTFTVHYLTIAKNLHLLFGKPGNKTRTAYLRIKKRRVALVKMYLLHLRNKRQQQYY